MKVFYLHGLNSAFTESGTFGTIKKYIPQIVGINYPYENPIETAKVLDSVFSKVKNEEVIIIGSSLGGFWAKYFSNKYSFRCLLINPSFKPSVSLLKYLDGREEVSMKNFVTNETKMLTIANVNNFIEFENAKENNSYVAILAGTLDSVISPEIKKMYKNYIVNYVDMGHQFSSKYIDEMMFLFNLLKNTYVI